MLRYDLIGPCVRMCYVKIRSWAKGLRQKKITVYKSFRSTRHFERNFSFSIHILFDNWVRNSLLLGSFRTSEGTNPLFFLHTDFLLRCSWSMLIVSRFILIYIRARKMLLKSSERSCLLPIFLLENIERFRLISCFTSDYCHCPVFIFLLVLQNLFPKMTALRMPGTLTTSSIFIVFPSSQGHSSAIHYHKPAS